MDLGKLECSQSWLLHWDSSCKKVQVISDHRLLLQGQVLLVMKAMGENYLTSNPHLPHHIQTAYICQFSVLIGISYFIFLGVCQDFCQIQSNYTSMICYFGHGWHLKIMFFFCFMLHNYFCINGCCNAYLEHINIQDLPNYAQHTVPIFSLPQEWLWCESWCGNATKARAKTIDLCNNPMTKEPKLQVKLCTSGFFFCLDLLNLYCLFPGC
jgi:hypothetical protein